MLACASTLLADFDAQTWRARAKARAASRALLPAFRSEDVTRVELLEGGQKLVAGAHGAADERLGRSSCSSRSKRPLTPPPSTSSCPRWAAPVHLRPVEQGPRSGCAWAWISRSCARVSVQAEKHSYRLALGGNAPDTRGRALRASQTSTASHRRWLVVAKSVAEDLAVDLDAFRLRSLVAVNEADVTRITITSPKSERHAAAQLRHEFPDRPPSSSRSLGQSRNAEEPCSSS